MNQAPTKQTEMPLFQVGAEDQNVRWMESYLKEVREWMTAAALAVLVGKPDSDDSRRWVRSLAQASDWVISGQKGYKHLEHSTPEEISHFINWMESQGKKMIGRAERMRRNAHAVFG